MKAHIVDNEASNLAGVLPDVIAQAREVRLAVAFVSMGGVSLLDECVQRALERGASLEFLIGLDGSATQPEAVNHLWGWSQDYDNAHLYCYGPSADGPIYHPKVYWATGVEVAAIVVGSSNMTRGGLVDNAEVNVVIEAAPDEEIVSDAFAAYVRLKFAPRRVVPDEELLSLYSELFKTRQGHREVVEATENASETAERLAEKINSLSPPTSSRRDLSGWLKAVYDLLPDEEFETADIYQHVETLRELYPENQNVKAKIRQQLQMLRDMGLLNHLARGRWCKPGLGGGEGNTDDV